MKTKHIMLSFFISFIVSCGITVYSMRGRPHGKPQQALTPQYTNGTTVLLFPEWSNSPSAFERLIHTNYYAVYDSGRWYVREKQPDGTLAQFWDDDVAEKTVEKHKPRFGLNIKWQIYKAMYDALSVTQAVTQMTR